MYYFVFNLLQIEFTIPANNGSDHSPHIQKGNILMDKGGYLIYGFGHMHTGGINATLYGQVMFNIHHHSVIVYDFVGS